MKPLLKIVLGLIVVLIVIGGGGHLYMSSAANGIMTRTIETHRVDFPIPFPLTEAEIGAEGLTGDLGKLAKDRAIARGKHLVDAFYVCGECHGKDFGGGTMVDDGAIGHFFGVNITSGKGGQVAQYKAADWDRIVRHGVRSDGKPTVMPSIDFANMSDRELSDIVSYIASMPPVDKEMPRPTYGPVGNVLLATGQIKLSADIIDHQKAHAALPPDAKVDLSFGKHMAQVCVGCHNASFSGGPIVGGPPDWPPASNITPEGMKDWKYDEFVKTMKDGKRRDGQPLRAPMDAMRKFAANWTETELKAVFAFLTSLPPTPTPGKQ